MPSLFVRTTSLAIGSQLIAESRLLRFWSSVAATATCLLNVHCVAADETRLSPTPIRQFEKSIELEAAGTTSANASLGDLDGDGDLDIVLAKGRHWPLHNRVLLNTGKGTSWEGHDIGTADRTYSILTVDIDNDQDLDLVVSNDNPDRNVIYRNDGNAAFTSYGSWGDSAWNTRNATYGDINGDGFPDLVAANRKGKSYACLNDQHGAFKKEDWIPIASESATSIVAVDVNQDTLVDLLVPQRDGAQSRVLINRGGDLSELVKFGGAASRSRTAAAADLDGDGNIDIIAGDERQGVQLYFGNEGGQFDEARSLKSGVVPYSVAIADLNLDGKMDVVVGYARNVGSIFFNTVNREFAESTFGDGAGVVYGLAIGDLTGDGFPEACCSPQRRNQHRVLQCTQRWLILVSHR